MKFAHLEISHRPAHSVLVPTNPSEVDPTALLKARTWLAYLHMEGKLSVKKLSDPKSEWLEYSDKEHASMIILESVPENVVAVIPYVSYAQYSQQPSLAFVRNNVEAQMLFTDVFLRASISYFKRNPKVLRYIKEETTE